MTHLWKRHRDSGDEKYLYAWCGRLVRRNTVVATVPSVNCQQCQAAFAKTIAAMPEVFEKDATR